MSGNHTAFFYGTLMEPRVFFRVTQGQSNPPGVIRDLYTFTPALLRDYCRHRVKGEDYPAITPEAGQSVLGTYVTGLTEANLAKLDQFEGDEYEKRQVKLRLLTKVGDAQGEGRVEGEEKDTAAYVFLYLDRIERGEWDFEHFRRERLQRWARDEIFFADEGIETGPSEDGGVNGVAQKEERSAV